MKNGMNDNNIIVFSIEEEFYSWCCWVQWESTERTSGGPVAG